MLLVWLLLNLNRSHLKHKVTFSQ